MARSDDVKDQDLTQALSARSAQWKIEQREIALCHLRLARRALIGASEISEKTPEVNRLIKAWGDELEAMVVAAGGQILSRKRPRIKSSKTCTIYIDECGQHKITAKDSFAAFALAAVIIRDDEADATDQCWKDWKAANLGSSEKLTHEPDVRWGRGSFYFGGDELRREAARASLANVIDDLKFTGIVCVLNRPAYYKLYGEDPINESLPGHPYLMTIDFVLERVVMALQAHFGGAKARVVIESRGAKEDAVMQYEFARLFLDGTTYVSATYFREQLLPGVEFRTKKENLTGLQIADLLARPCAEKILNSKSTPARWPEFRKKLCPGIETENSILGLKALPWDDSLKNVWES